LTPEIVIRFHAYGGPEVVGLEEIPVPETKSGEVLLEIS
jgi:NADPH:quinone reductase-like Zn-dependent oxidoreductase